MSRASTVHKFKLVMRALVLSAVVFIGTCALAQDVGPDAQVREPASGFGFGGTEEQAQADSEPPITDAEMRAIEDQLLEQQSALNQTNARLAAMEQQLAEQRALADDRDASADQRSVAANQTAQEEARVVRTRELQHVLLDLQDVQELIQAGEDDLDAQLGNAAASLQTAANAATVASPRESEHLVRAQLELMRVPGMMATRNTHHASLAVLEAQQHAASALALARAQQQVTR